MPARFIIRCLSIDHKKTCDNFERLFGGFCNFGWNMDQFLYSRDQVAVQTMVFIGRTRYEKGQIEYVDQKGDGNSFSG